MHRQFANEKLCSGQTGKLSHSIKKKKTSSVFIFVVRNTLVSHLNFLGRPHFIINGLMTDPDKNTWREKNLQ